MPGPSKDNPTQQPRGDRVRRWLATRDYLRLAGGVPALLTVALWIWAAAYLVRQQPERIEGDWRLGGMRALFRQDFNTAALVWRALVDMHKPPLQEYQYRLALSLRALGRDREADVLFRQLAPLERAVYAPAHLYVASRLLGSARPTRDTRAQLERQLKNAIALDSGHPEAHELLGRMYLESGQTNEAKRHLVLAAATRGEAAMPLAVLLKAEGDPNAARSYVERSQRFFRDRVTQNGADDLSALLGLTKAMMELGNYDGALKELESAQRVRPIPEYAAAIGRASAAWADFLAREKPDATRERLEVVERGLRYAPQDISLLLHLVRLSDLSGPGATSVQAALDEMLAEGGRTQFVHLFCGLRAKGPAEAEAARRHFEMALELAPHLRVVANNLALVLAFGPSPDYERALNLIEPLARNQPDNYRLRDTRGQILAKLGRHEEAVKDLEFSVQGLPVAALPPTCLALKDSYTALGKPELAAKYERIAASFGVTNRDIRLVPPTRRAPARR